MLSPSPIDVVVSRVAAAVARAWNQAKSEQTPAKDEEEAAFLAIAYQYLSEREVAISNDIARIADAASSSGSYEAFPSDNRLLDRLFRTLGGPDPLLDRVIWVLGVLLAAAFPFVFIMSAIVQYGIVSTLEITTSVVFLCIGLHYLFTYLSEHELAFAGHPIFWQHFQSRTSWEIDSERSQVLAMIVSSSVVPSPGEGQDNPTISDPDLLLAKENPVPIPPGVAEYVFCTGRVTIDELGNDFREPKRQHIIVIVRGVHVVPA